ncbi:MAG: choice-of-anchor Q domain-containing protein, partial [Moraxellaceae bacterium]
ALSSMLDIASVTLVGNQGAAGLLYDGRAQLRIVNSILAYNQNIDCRYLPRDGVRLNELNGVVTRSNLIGGDRVSPSTDPTITYEQLFSIPLSRSCELPTNVSAPPLVSIPADKPDTPREIDYTRVTTAIDATDTNRYTKNATQNSILYPLADYGVGLQGLLPKKQDDAAKPSAVDRGATLNECGGTDQRGVDRQSGVKNKLTNTAESPRCDIGAMELGQITVNDDADAVNRSYVEQVEAKRFNFTDAELADLTAPERELVRRVTKDDDEYKAKYKANFSFRRAFIDVFSNDVPQESVDDQTTPPTSSFVERYSGDYQVIDVKSYGTGPDVLLTDQTPVASGNTDQVKCVWIEDMKRLVVYRLDGVTTPSGDVERCQYTVKEPDGSTSTGIVQTRISNIRPIAKNDTYTLRRGQESLSFNVLENDNDDGDGPLGSLHEPEDRAAFFNAGDQVNIKIKKAPVLGRLVFEREAQCPDNSATRPNEICYGGRVTYLVDNTFSPFNDSFTYAVLDQDKTESNIATVEIINEATTTEDTRDGSKGILAGGGAWSWFGLIGLAGLAAFAKRRRRT